MLDSTSVAVIARSAEVLGMAGRDAFIWWVVAQHLGTVVGWVFLVVIVRHVTSAISSAFRSHQLAKRILSLADPHNDGGSIYDRDWKKIEAWVVDATKSGGR